jgi:hypothetical protein
MVFLEDEVNGRVLVFRLSLYRHPSTCILFSSHFTSEIKNKKNWDGTHSDIVCSVCKISGYVRETDTLKSICRQRYQTDVFKGSWC